MYKHRICCLFCIKVSHGTIMSMYEIIQEELQLGIRSNIAMLRWICMRRKHEK